MISGFLLAGCQQSAPLAPSQVSTATSTAIVQVIEPDDIETLQKHFKSNSYSWDNLDSGVPPLIVTRFPEDLGHHLKPEEKKQTFLLSLLPMVLLANQAIEAEREEIQTLFTRHDHKGLLSAEEQKRLQEMAEYYKLQGDPVTDRRARALLLHRVDILPPSLVLAQAAAESGWGTSRFAREGNNLFGQRTYRTGNGIVPANRPTGETHEVKRFGNLFDSVRSYMRNLNTHNAYREFRELRAKLRRSDRPLNGVILASGLDAYSTRNGDYIDDVRVIIRTNDLSRTNQAFLRATAPSSTSSFIPTMAELLASKAEAAELPARNPSALWANP
ncbi:MAG: glucosaminidase domain-containing protein [Desulfuromonadales bacterium]|nr:glucosaminidase domain-containing protein [Desulfuromonadales bacterium]